MNRESSGVNRESSVLSRLMSPQEIADYLQMPVATLQTWRAKGTGPRGYRIGKHVRYRLEDVETWLAEHADREEEALRAVRSD